MPSAEKDGRNEANELRKADKEVEQRLANPDSGQRAPDGARGALALREGDGQGDARERRRQLRLIERAIVGGWKLPPECLEELGAKLWAIASNEKAGHRERLAASKVLAELGRQNQADYFHEHPSTQKVEVAAVRADTPADIDRALLEAKRRMGMLPPADGPK